MAGLMHDARKVESRRCWSQKFSLVLQMSLEVGKFSMVACLGRPGASAEGAYLRSARPQTHIFGEGAQSVCRGMLASFPPISPRVRFD